MKRIDLFSRLLFCAVIGTCGAATADNGFRATAYPVDGIVIDGQLDDWPDLNEYPIALPSLHMGEPDEGFEGSFSVGYDPEDRVLFVAGSVTDGEPDLIMEGAQASAHLFADGFEVYLTDPAFPVPWQIAMRGHELIVQSQEGAMELDDPQSLAQGAVTTTGTTIQFEVRIDLTPFVGSASELTKTTLAFDLVYFDIDPDGRAFLKWGAGGNKYSDTSAMGRLTFTDRPSAVVTTGTAKIGVTWPNGLPAPFATVTIDGEIDLNVGTDGTGQFRLGPGEHGVSTASGDSVTVVVAPGERTDAALLYDPPPSEVQFTSRPLVSEPLDVVEPESNPAGPGQRTGSWHTLGIADGLSDPTVLDILQDRDGAMWFATAGGLNRYDARREMTTYTKDSGLPCSSTRRLAEQPDGTLWIACGSWGSTRGLTRRMGGRWSRHGTDDGVGHVHEMEVGSAGLWVLATDESRWSEQKSIHLIVGDTVLTPHCDGVPLTALAMAVDEKGDLWFVDRRGLFHLEEGSLRHVPCPGTFAGIEEMDVEHGAVVFRSQRQVDRLEGSEHTTVLELPHQGRMVDVVGGIRLDDGVLWITARDTVYRWRDGRLDLIGDAIGGEGWQPTRIVASAEGDLWFGTGGNATFGTGVVRFDRGITSFTAEDGLPSYGVMALAETPDGTIWAATWEGLAWFNGVGFTSVPGIPRVDELVVDSDERLWAFGWEGLHICQGLQCEERSSGPTSFGRGAVLAPDGSVWSAGFEGLFRHTPARSDLVDTTGAWGEGGGSWGILSQSDGLLVLSSSGQVRLRSWDGEWSAPLPAQIPQAYSDAFFRDSRGDLWVGHTPQNGAEEWLLRCTGSTCERASSQVGLGLKGASGITEDATGRMWFSTYGAGVTQWDGLVSQTLTDRDGLPQNAVQEVLTADNGDIWIATDGGLARYRVSATPPLISIDEVRTQHADVSSTSTLDGDEVTFSFQGSSYKTRVGQMAYVYRLLGEHDDWRVTRAESVRYSGLSLGDYTFEVKAVDRDLNYSEPARVTHIVHLPYERMSWAGGLLFALLLVGWQTQRVVRRDRRLSQQNRALEEQASNLIEARDQAQAANKAKSQFLANMSHEIRTPMNAILGYAQILKRSDSLAGDHRHAVETIQRSGDHLLNLINDVLDISKIEAGRMELTPDDFDLREMVHGISVMFDVHCREKGLAWTLEGLPAEATPVHADEAKLRQVLINLLGNAVKFTHEGSVALRLKALDANGATRRFRIEVQDTGPGMTAAERDAIFQPFQQGTAGHESGGTGLGLTITHRHLELMGSRLEVDSTPGSGSTFGFEIELPVAEAELRGRDVDAFTSARRLQEGQSVKVLLADDVRENRDILETMLADLGAQVTTATNGREALDALEADRPDILFLDVRMPVMDGLEAVKQLRQMHEYDDVKAIAISASVLEHERAEFLESGFDDFIDKPFRFERVCAALVEQLGVAFEEESVAAEAPTDDNTNWVGTPVDGDLATRLRDAAELYAVTELSGLCDELAQAGGEQARLAEHIRSLSQRQDMDAIVALLPEPADA